MKFAPGKKSKGVMVYMSECGEYAVSRHVTGDPTQKWVACRLRESGRGADSWEIISTHRTRRAAEKACKDGFQAIIMGVEH